MSVNLKKVFDDLSDKEKFQLAAYYLCVPQPQPKPDYEQFAEICGYKNASSATVMFNTLRRKLKAATGGADDNDTTTPAKTSAKKKSTKEISENDGSVSKKPKGKKRAKADVGKGSDSDEAVEQATPVKRARKPKQAPAEEQTMPGSMSEPQLEVKSEMDMEPEEATFHMLDFVNTADVESAYY